MDSTNVSTLYNYFCSKNYKNHDPILFEEYMWMKRCHLGGIQYLNPKYEDKKVKSYGYDYRGYYGMILNSKKLKIPTKHGNEVTLEELPAKYSELEPGYYHVKITSDDDDFNKIFAFSKKDNVYLDISLAQAMKFKKSFNVSIELIHDGKPNAYLYDKKCMVTLNSISNEWYNKLKKVKDEFPKNRLVKHLMSTAWSTMNQKNVISYTLDEINELVKDKNVTVGWRPTNDYIIIDENKFDNEEKTKVTKHLYVLLDSKKPVKHNIRLLPYVTAFSRNIIGEVARENLDGVVRIHTDGIVFDTEMEFNDIFEKDELIPEDKTTGKILWTHVNKYEKV
jgi:hypothetical protein